MIFQVQAATVQDTYILIHLTNSIPIGIVNNDIGHAFSSMKSRVIGVLESSRGRRLISTYERHIRVEVFLLRNEKLSFGEITKACTWLLFFGIYLL